MLNPIIDGYHLTRVLMDGGSSLNLIYQDTVRKMGLDLSRISQSSTTIKAVISGVEVHCIGSLMLEVVFGSSDNFRSEELIFDITPFGSGYHALLGRTAFARFNAVPHYAYLKLKMPGPRGVITISGNTERSLRAEDYVAALATEPLNGPSNPSNSSVFETTDTARRVRCTTSCSSPDKPELD